MEVKKCESVSNKLTYLGIEIDTTAGELHQLEEKLQRVKAVVQEWLGCKLGRRRELESLMSLLQHAMKIVWPRWRFVRRVVALMTSVYNRDCFIRLNAEICLDLEWWHQFIQQLNRISLLRTKPS